MRRLTTLIALVLALGARVEAGAKPSKPPKPTVAKTHVAKGRSAKGATTKGSSVKGASIKTKGAEAHSSRHSGKVAKSEAKLATSSSSTSGTLTTTTGGTSTRTIDFTGTALAGKLQKNSALRSKIEAKLQAAGYTGTVYEAAYGFKNLGQLNATTNQVQNQGHSFELLKVLMTGTYVDPKTQVVYRANRLPDGTVKLVSAETATNPASTMSLGQAKQTIAAGAEMPEIVTVPPTTTTSTSGTSSTKVTSATR